MRLRLTEVPGIPADWSDITAGAPPVANSRWITFGQSWYPGKFHTYEMRSRSGECVVALGGTVLEQPAQPARRDPYAILSGAVADQGFLPDGPHPWLGSQPSDLFPCLLLMYPYYQTFPVGTGADDPAALHTYLTELISWCRDRGVRSIAMLYLVPRADPLMRRMRESGFTIHPLIDRCDLDVTWDGFDGYLRSLPSKRRVEVRRELAQIEHRDLVTVSRPLAADEPELLDMRCALVAKYTGGADRAAEAHMLDQIREHVSAEDIVVFAVMEGDRTVSFSLFIQDGDEWSAMLVGSDYSTPNSAFGYFSTLFYQPAEQAPGRGIKKIWYGAASIDAKRRRGCHVTPCFAAQLRIPG